MAIAVSGYFSSFRHGESPFLPARCFHRLPLQIYSYLQTTDRIFDPIALLWDAPQN